MTILIISEINDFTEFLTKNSERKVSYFCTVFASMQQFPQRKSFVEKQIYLLLHSVKFEACSCLQILREIELNYLEAINHDFGEGVFISELPIHVNF